MLEDEYYRQLAADEPDRFTFVDGGVFLRDDAGQYRWTMLCVSDDEPGCGPDGTVGVRTGRLDLDVTAVTGQVGLNAGLLRSYAVRALAAGSVPAQVALEVSRLLSNRTIRARVTGTIDQPVVNVNVVGVLTEAAVLYVLEAYFLPTR